MIVGRGKKLRQTMTGTSCDVAVSPYDGSVSSHDGAVAVPPCDGALTSELWQSTAETRTQAGRRAEL
jgi:hypothetical protein